MRIERTVMQFYQETTQWNDTVKNHIYLLSADKSKMFAYVKADSNSVFTFKNPIRIDTRGRRFVAVKNKWNYKIQTQKLNPQWQIKGSKGDVYIIEQTDAGLTCTCTGFKFRYNCKHIKQVDK